MGFAGKSGASFWTGEVEMPSVLNGETKHVAQFAFQGRHRF